MTVLSGYPFPTLILMQLGKTECYLLTMPHLIVRSLNFVEVCGTVPRFFILKLVRLAIGVKDSISKLDFMFKSCTKLSNLVDSYGKDSSGLLEPQYEHR